MQQDIFKRIDGLSPQKRTLLLRKMGTRQNQALPQIVHTSSPSQNTAPLSFAQEQLWLLDQVEQGNSSYHVPLTLRLRGKLALSALETSLTTIINRHASLRSVFQLIEDQPRQVVLPAQPCLLPVIDLQTLPISGREQVLRGIAEREVLSPFNLATGPLLRMLLVRLSPQEHALLLFMHHIIADGFSVRLLWQELFTLYSSLHRGSSASLPSLALQYTDFAIWQRSYLNASYMEDGLAYWQKQLAAVPPLELPTSYARPPLQTFHGQHFSLQMPLALSQQFKEFAQNERITLFMGLIASFAILLARYSGQDDIAIGTPVTNRTDRHLEALIGLFVNTLVLRTRLPHMISSREFLQQMRRTILEAYQHQEIPFSKIIQAVQPERDPSRSPLFQAMFSLQEAQPDNHVLGDLEISILEYQNLTTKYDLSASIIDSPQGFLAILEYNSDLFAAPTIQAMAHHWQRILEAIVQNPARNIWELPLLGPAERAHMLFDWNATTAELPSSFLHEMFEAQVTRTPDTCALLFDHHSLTYQELNNLANQVAWALREQGIGPELLVGLYLERSPELIIGLLGVLKAGAAYVPLDPNYPNQRLTFMIRDSQLSCLLTTEAFSEDFADLPIKRLCLDKNVLQPGCVQHNPQRYIKATNLAYVIYTSGSTGMPKGIALSHQALQNFCHSMATRFPLTTQETLLAVTSLSFDISILELLVPLTQGAIVHIVPQDSIADGLGLLSLLEQVPTSMMQATPITWRLLLAHGWSGNKQMKILCGGEALPSSLARELLSRGKELWNMYGPTEATVWSTAAHIQQETATVSIGSPIENTAIYILDNYLQPVPIGVIGELWIGGIGLARGYLGQPDLTADRFLPNPFGKEAGERMYRTGDLASYRADGTIECLGRIDHQVKIRGFRIEIKEIETVLQQYPAVQTCVVALKKEPQAHHYLVAFLQLYPDIFFSLDDLYSHLRTYLPTYMLPTAIALLDEFPLTPNKKIDRQQLLAADIAFLEHGNGYVAPTTERERQLAHIWQEVLGVEKVGIYDNFFTLGGDSLSLLLMIDKALGIGLDLQPKHLNHAQTIADISKL